MKKYSLVFAGAALLLLNQGCQKCEVCSYTYTDSSSGQQVTTDVGNQCGVQTDLAQLETDCQAAAQTVNGTCDCTAQ